MNEVHVTKIAAELNLMHKQVRATALLFDDVVKVHQKVTATVLDVDLKRRRISLSLKKKQEYNPIV